MATRDAGMVTAETAVVLPVLFVVLVASVWVLACVAAQLRCVDAARIGARAAARGDAAGSIERVTARVAPANAEVAVLRDGDEVTVVVRAVIRPFGGVLDGLPGTPVAGRATAITEDGLP